MTAKCFRVKLGGGGLGHNSGTFPSLSVKLPLTAMFLSYFLNEVVNVFIETTGPISLNLFRYSSTVSGQPYFHNIQTDDNRRACGGDSMCVYTHRNTTEFHSIR